MDVGHNIEAVQELLKTLKYKCHNESLIFVFGTSGHKPAGFMIKAIQDFILDRNEGEIYLINGDNQRSKPVEKVLNETINTDNLKVVCNGDIKGTLQEIVDNQGYSNKVRIIRLL